MSGANSVAPESDIEAATAPPYVLHRERVRSEWVDYNGHLNAACYGLVFDHATDVLLDALGIGERWVRAGRFSTFAVEAHTLFRRELPDGAPVVVSAQLLAADAKRIHYFHRMFHGTDGYLAATFEQLSICVDHQVRRSAPFPADAAARIGELLALHRSLSWPAEAGRQVCLPGSDATR